MATYATLPSETSLAVMICQPRHSILSTRSSLAYSQRLRSSHHIAFLPQPADHVDIITNIIVIDSNYVSRQCFIDLV